MSQCLCTSSWASQAAFSPCLVLNLRDFSICHCRNPFNTGIHEEAKAPCLAHTSCPVLSTQIFSTVSNRYLQVDTSQEKVSEYTFEEGYWKPCPCLSLPVPTQVLPVSTCRIRNCPGPHLWVSHFCIYSLKLVLLWTCPIIFEKSTSWKWPSCSRVTKYFGAVLWITSQ